MLDLAMSFALVCFALAIVLNFLRFVTAPGLPDRIIAADTMVVNVIALMLLYSGFRTTSLYLEAALLFSLTGFVATVGYCKYLLRGSIVE